jgi:RND family efflux transporter MFP subunit
MTGATGEKYFPGVIRENAAVNLGFKTAGQILHIHVREGQRVQQGDLIAELDTADYRLQLEATQAQYEQVKAEAERIEELYRRKSVSGNDYEKAMSGKKMLEVKLQADRNKMDYTRLTAPFAGYIQSVHFKPSEMIDAGMSLVTLIDVRRMIVEINIPASLFVEKDSFLRFDCRADVLPGKVFPLELIGVNPKADNLQLYKVQLQLDPRHDNRLAAGMNVRVSIAYSTGSLRSWSLPFNAVFHEGGKSYIWVVDAATDRVQRREVTVQGIDGKGGIAVQADIAGDDRIVTAGVKSLSEHQQVRVLPPTSETNVGGLL